MAEKNTPQLTICIPTYNRAVMLDQCLAALYDIQEKSHSFCLVVADNGSTDNTKGIIAKWSPKFQNFETIYQQINVGYDRNVYALYSNLKTDYCWLLGDCDSISEPSFSKIEKHINEGYDFVVINTDEEKFGQEGKIYTKAEDFICEQGWHVSKLSACVLHRRILDSKYMKRYFDSHFIHWGILMEYISEADTFSALFDPTIPLVYLKDSGNYRQSQNGTWRQIPFYVWGRCWSQLVLSLPIKFPYELKMKVITDHERKYHWFSLKNLIKNKIKFGEPYIKNYKENRQFVKMVTVASPVLSDLIMYLPIEPVFKMLISLKNRIISH